MITDENIASKRHKKGEEYVFMSKNSRSSISCTIRSTLANGEKKCENSKHTKSYVPKCNYESASVPLGFPSETF